VLEAIPAERIVRHVTEERDDALQNAVLEAIPAERIVRHVTEERDDALQNAVLEAIPAEKRLRGLSPEELAESLSEEQAVRLRELLDRKRRGQ
jgi:ribosome-binding protein aMBF1 (putative translation factor)